MNEDKEISCLDLEKHTLDYTLNGAQLMLINNALIDLMENEGKIEEFGCDKCIARLEPLIELVGQGLEHIEMHIEEDKNDTVTENGE